MDKLVGAFSGVLKTPSTPQAQPQAPQGDRQYLRLPLESARKLRWFEKADVQALTKSHFREKRELLDTIAALKKVFLRQGVTEAKLDAEVSAHLRSAEELAESHEGVASVLLAALEPHVQELRFENERLQAAIKLSHHAAPAAAPGMPAEHRGSAGESCVADEQSAARPGVAASTSLTMTSGRAVPRRLEHLDLAQLASQSEGSSACMELAALEAQCAEYGKQVSELKAALAKQQQHAATSAAAAASSRRRGPDGGEGSLVHLQDMVLELQEAARDEARRAARAEARAARLEGELKALQAQHRTLVKDQAALQQQLVEAQQQAEAAAACAAARAAAGEELRAAAEAREEAEALRQAKESLQASLAAAQGCAARMEAELQLEQQRRASALHEAEAVARRSDELVAANRQLTERLAGSRAELELAAYHKKLCGELTAANSQLQLQLVELAGQHQGALRRAEELAARLAAAEDQLLSAEARARAAEASVAAEVERRCAAVLSSRALWPQQLREEVGALERRVSELEEASRRAEVAEAAEAEAQEQLRTKTEELAALSSESLALASSSASQLQQLREALAESQARAAGLRDDLAAERAAAASALAAAAEAAASGRGGSRAGQQEERNFLTQHGSGGSWKQHSNGNSSSNLHGMTVDSAHATPPSLSTAVMTPKWQVQNKVGGGGLYNLDSSSSSSSLDPASAAGGRGPVPTGAAAAAADISGGFGGSRATASSHGGAGAGGGGTAGGGGAAGLSSVDLVYMKNVLFKFLEAHVCNKVAERDVLLPAVATLLQASHEEYTALQKILRATVPPSRQMLSVLGWTR